MNAKLHLLGWAIFMVGELMGNPLPMPNCKVEFPGTATLNYGAACGAANLNGNLLLGEITPMGDGDSFTFDAPANIFIDGNFNVFFEGNGTLIIPAGVTVTLDGNFNLYQAGNACKSPDICSIEVIVAGTLNVSGNFNNEANGITFSGLGTVDVEGNFNNSHTGCLSCGLSCPVFSGDPADCNNDGDDCGAGDFCADAYLGAAGVAPISLSAFDGQALQDGVELTWETVAEIHNERFEIERSADGNTFELAGIRMSTWEAGDLSRLYTFRDSVPYAPDSYYRLKQVDIDGIFTYSQVIRVSTGSLSASGPDIYPNPAHSQVRIFFPQGIREVEIISPLGVRVGRYATQGEAACLLSLQGLPRALYHLKIYTDAGVFTGKLVKE